MPKISYHNGVDAIRIAEHPLKLQLRAEGQLFQETDNGKHARAAMAAVAQAMPGEAEDDVIDRLEKLQRSGALIAIEIENILHLYPDLRKPFCDRCEDTGVLDSSHLSLDPCPICNPETAHPTGRV